MSRKLQKLISRRIVADLIIPFIFFCSSVHSGPLLELEERLISLYQEKADSVVRVKVATKSLDSNGDEHNSLTVISGFFISEDAKVVTNAIPQENIVRLWIVKDGVSYIAEHIGTDRHSNISLIQAVNLPKSFTPVSLISPVKTSKIGSFAFAVSSPLDFAPSPSWGLVTGFESQFDRLTFPFTYTRVSIPIGPAEGGSPFFDLDGNLIGIGVAALPDLSSGYIVPTAAIQRIVSHLQKDGKAMYGFIPITFEEKSDNTKSENQVYIKSIDTDSQARKAGIKPDDILVACGDIAIVGLNQLRDLIFFSEPGTFLSMTIVRDGKEIEFALLIESKNRDADPLVTIQN